MSKTKTKRLNIRLTEDEYSKMRQAAEKISLSISDYVLAKTVYETNYKTNQDLAVCFNEGFEQLNKRLEAIERIISRKESKRSERPL